MMRAGAVFAAALALASCVDEPVYDGRFCEPLSPCPGGFECVGGTCHRECAVNDECVLEGEVCVSGLCTPLSGGVDAGELEKDAGDLDAASLDAAVECTAASECVSPGPCEESAGADCDRGVCVYASIECRDPPKAECVDNDTLFRTYSNIGACNGANDECEYTSMTVPCADCTASCLEPCTAVACNDDNGGCRTGGFCMPGAPGDPPTCIYENAEDGTACTKDDGSDGVCQGGDCTECVDGADCDDLNPCTNDVCDTANGTCSHTMAIGACDDGDACTQNDVCMTGVCVGTNAIDCSTGAPECRQGSGSCDPATGACSFPPANMGTACSADGNACSDDVCDGAGSCVHPDRQLACNQPPGQCYDANGACAPATGMCAYPASANTRGCDDANACTHTDHCDGAGACGGTSYSCSDANVCTSDVCDGVGGCSNPRIAPPNLNPSNGASVGSMDVTLTWTGCADAVSYEVDIDWMRADGTWADYFVYMNEPNPSKTFYPCSNAAPGLPCNGDFRFRVRANNGAFGPWSAFAYWHWGNCRTC